jgi:cell division protein FtsQ
MIASIRTDRRVRVGLLCLAIAIPLLGGGWLWLRQSSFVSVEHVRISGVKGTQAGPIEAALEEAARGMSTMRVSTTKLREAVARFPVVQEVRASASFPHSLHIIVVEQQPVATLQVAGLKTAVASNGVVLGPELISSSLPTVTGYYEPARGQRLHNASLLESLSVLGAAPPLLAKLAQRAYEGPRGLTVAMKNGLLVYFGDSSRPHAKWLSLARVLADKSSAGAVYVDVRLPERPAAGMSSETTSATSSSAPAGGTESTVSALAAGLTGGKTEPSTEHEEPESSAGGEPSESTTEPSTSQAPAEALSEAPQATSESGG